METKKSKKPETNFDDFWPLLKEEADRQKLKKGEWFRKAGIDYQRYSEFDRDERTRDVSVKYFLKLIGGLNVKIDDSQRRLGRKFSDAQIRLLKFDAKVDAERDWLEMMLNDPEKMKICKTIVLSGK